MRELPSELQVLCNSDFSFDEVKHPSDLLVKILPNEVIIGPADSTPTYWHIDENSDRRNNVGRICGGGGIIRFNIKGSSLYYEIHELHSSLIGLDSDYQRFGWGEWVHGRSMFQRYGV